MQKYLKNDLIIGKILVVNSFLYLYKEPESFHSAFALLLYYITYYYIIYYILLYYIRVNVTQ